MRMSLGLFVLSSLVLMSAGDSSLTQVKNLASNLMNGFSGTYNGLTSSMIPSGSDGGPIGKIWQILVRPRLHSGKPTAIVYLQNILVVYVKFISDIISFLYDIPWALWSSEKVNFSLFRAVLKRHDLTFNGFKAAAKYVVHGHNERLYMAIDTEVSSSSSSSSEESQTIAPPIVQRMMVRNS